MPNSILLSRDTLAPDIALLTFNRPTSHNALDTDAMIAFSEAIDQLDSDPDLRVLILTGAGERAFCSGADIADMSRRATEADAVAMINRMGDALLKMERLPIPVIAALNGYALGGGAEIAMACDLRLVDENARLGFVQIKRALIPGWGGGQRLMRHLGYARTMDILLRGHTMRAEEMQSLGLANQIVPKGDALTHALQFARQIAAHDPTLIRAIKALGQAGLHQPFDNALMTERSLFPALWIGQGRIHSMQEFLEGKQPEAKS